MRGEDARPGAVKGGGRRGRLGSEPATTSPGRWAAVSGRSYVASALPKHLGPEEVDVERGEGNERQGAMMGRAERRKLRL